MRLGAHIGADVDIRDRDVLETADDMRPGRVKVDRLDAVGTRKQLALYGVSISATPTAISQDPDTRSK